MVQRYRIDLARGALIIWRALVKVLTEALNWEPLEAAEAASLYDLGHVYLSDGNIQR